MADNTDDLVWLEELEECLEECAAKTPEFTQEKSEYDPLRDAREECAKLGLEMFVSDGRLLMLDIDDGKYVETVSVQMLKRWLGIGPGDILVTTSKSGKGHHVYIRLPKYVGELERILLQACLGSDPKREMLNWHRMKEKGEGGVTLFETAEEAVRVAQFLHDTTPKEEKHGRAEDPAF